MINAVRICFSSTSRTTVRAKTQLKQLRGEEGGRRGRGTKLLLITSKSTLEWGYIREHRGNMRLYLFISFRSEPSIAHIDFNLCTRVIENELSLYQISIRVT